MVIDTIVQRIRGNGKVTLWTSGWFEMQFEIQFKIQFKI